jgi:hypothetical protein
MAVTVYLYDSSLAAVTSTNIAIEEQDDTGLIIDTQSNSNLTPGTSEYGARLIAPAPPRPVVIFIDDLYLHFAPVAIGKMHGAQANTVRVILYPLPAPTGSGGTVVASLEDAAVEVNSNVQQKKWTPAQGLAVRSLIDSVVAAYLVPPPGSLGSRLERWEQKLEAYGISLS